MERLEALKKFVEEEPDDPFNRYALALETLKSDSDKAYQLFEELIKGNAEYLPTYYPFAQLLVERKNSIRAEEIFKAGLEMARKQKDAKAVREIQTAWNDWKDLES